MFLDIIFKYKFELCLKVINLFYSTVKFFCNTERMFIMIDKISFGDAVQTFRKTDNNYISQKPKKEFSKDAPAYLAAALSGLAVIGVAYLIAGNKGAAGVKNKVKESQKVLTETAQRAGNDKLSRQMPKSVPQTVESSAAVKASESEIIQNIDTKYLNSSQRNTVEESRLTVVNTAQQAEYDNNIAFRPMKAKQKRAINKLNKRNKKQRQQTNTIEAFQPNAIIKKLYSLIPAENKKTAATAELIPIQGMGKFIA